VIKPDLPGFVPALEDRDVLQQRPPKLLWASAFIFSATRVKGSNGAQRVGCCYCDDCVLLMFISRRALPPRGVPKTCRFPVPLSLAISMAARPGFERSAKG
jgi:hypothetical protein